MAPVVLSPCRRPRRRLGPRCSQRRSSCGRRGRCPSIPAAGRSVSHCSPAPPSSCTRARDSLLRWPFRSSRSATIRPAPRLSMPCSRALLLVLSWQEPQTGVFFALGPLLAPIAALALLPLAALTIRSPVRRAAQVGLAVLAAGPRCRHPRLTASVRRRRCACRPGPRGERRPPHVCCPRSGRPSRRGRRSGSRSVVLAAVAALLPFARARGPWALAILGAGFLAAALLAAPTVAAAPIAVAVWATCVAVAVR